jgi:hypothetical protein
MQVKAVGMGVGLGIAALFNTACPTETKECNCPNGTVHPIGTGTCCDGEDCNCIKEYIINIDGMKPITIEDATRSISNDNLTLIKLVIRNIYK